MCIRDRVREVEKSSVKVLTSRHHEIINLLEKMLEKGIPDLTMSELASKLKISLRTLYEIAPSKDQLITMTVDNILKELGKSALERVSKIESPIDKLDTYLGIVNQAVGPKFDAYIKGLGKINGSSEMIDYHEDFIIFYYVILYNLYYSIILHYTLPMAMEQPSPMGNGPPFPL